LASACTVTSTDDDDTIVGAGGNTTATTSQSTTSAGGTGAQGGAGVGGSANCISCSDYLADPDATEAELCGYENGNCAPGSSCELALAFSVCVCGDGAGMAGACEEDCGGSCGAGGEDTPQCQTCIEGFCSSQQTDCETDMGG
jgi:hypothetical protein